MNNLRQNKRQHYDQWNGQSLDQILASNPLRTGNASGQGSRVLAKIQKSQHRVVIGKPIETRIVDLNSQLSHVPINNTRSPFILNQIKPPGDTNSIQQFQTPQRDKNLGPIRPPSNVSQRRGVSSGIRQSGQMVMADWRNPNLNRNNNRAFPISSNIQLGLDNIRPSNIHNDVLERNNNFEMPNLDFSREEEKAEPILGDNFDLNNHLELRHLIDMDDLNHIEQLLQPNQHFSSNLNNFRSNNRANQLRQQTNINRIEERKQNERSNNQQQQQRGRGDNGRQTNNNFVNNDRIIQEILDFPTRVNRIRGLQNLQERIDLYDNLLDEIEHFQSETDQIAQNIAQIDNMIVRASQKPAELKGISEEGLAKQKKIVYTLDQSFVGDNTCSICIKQFIDQEKGYKLICGHMFHDGCIEPWFQQSHFCPNCRKDLN